MPNILSSQGLDINNVTQVGVAGLLQSNFLISPAEGYFIAESQFSIDEEYLAEILENNVEITNITFSNTTLGFAPDNKVNVNITWAANTTLTDDIDFNLAINFNDINQVYDVNATLVTLPFIRGGGYENSDNIWSNIIVEILPNPENIVGVSQVSNFNIVNDNTYANQAQGLITFAATEDGPMVVCDVQFKASSTEGMRAFIQSDINTSWTIDGDDGQAGDFTWLLIQVINDQFGNPYSYIYRLQYTRDNEGPSEVEFDSFTYYCLENSNPYSITNAGSNQLVVDAVGAGDALDGAGTLTSEAEKSLVINNIPSEDVTFSFDANWAQAGDQVPFYLGGNQYTYRFDVNAIDVGLANRTLTVSVRDDKYPLILRATFTIYQQTDPYILLKIATDNVDSIEMFYDEYVDSGYDGSFSSNEAIFTSTGKVISHVSPAATEWQYIPSDDGPQSLLAYGGDETLLGETQGITHYVYAFTNTSVTLAQMQEIPLSIVQDQYPVGSSTPKDWVIPQSTGWDQIGGNNSGIFKYPIAIRNQDERNNFGALINTNTNRTANLSIVHPQDATISSAATIEQDNTWRAADKSILKIGSISTTFSAVPSGNYTEDPSSIPSDIGSTSTYRLYVTVEDPSSLTEFNMRTLISDDKQYPPPYVTVINSGSYTTSENVDVVESSNGTPESWVNQAVEVDNLTLNLNYDPTDADNNYQYFFDYTVAANTSLGERYIQFQVFHPQRRLFTPADWNAYSFSTDIIKHTQQEPSTAQLAPEVGGDAEQMYFNWGEGIQQKNIIAQWTGSAPTIGLWDELTEQYFVFAAGTTALTGFSYQQVSLSDTSYLLTCSFPENTPDNERSNTLGIWHSSVDPNSEFPNDTITLTQYAQPFDEANFWVLSQTLAGFDEQTSAAGSVTVYFKVSDYSADDFANGTNNPTVQVKRWNGLSVELGEYADDNGDYDDLGILPSYASIIASLTPNPSWNMVDPALGIQYTHSLVVNYSEYTAGEPYYFAIKAKHQYEDDYAIENHSFVTILPSQTLSLNPSVFIDTGDGNFVPNSTFLPSNTQRIKLRLTYSSFSDSALYPSNLLIPATDTTNYTYARFLNATTSTSVFAEDSGSEFDNIAQENIPLMFATGPDGENTTHVIDKPFQQGFEGFTDNNNANNNKNNATPVVAAFPLAKLDVVLNVRQNDTGSAINSRIGFWKGDNVPKTSLINTNYAFNSGGAFGPYQSANCISNFIDPTAQGQFGNIFNTYSMHHLYDEADTTGYAYTIDADSTSAVIADLKNKLVYKPIQSSEYSGTDIHDGFTWNIDSLSPYPTFSNSTGEVALRFLIFNPSTASAGGQYEDANFQYNAVNSIGTPHKFGRNKLLGVSFEVEDFEKFDDAMTDEEVQCGFLYKANQNHAYELNYVSDGQSNQNNYTTGIGDTWEVPNNILNIDGVTDDYLNTFRNALTFSSNGKYQGVIKQGAMNNSSCINFFAKAKAKFRIKNLKVWQIRNDIRIRPNGSAIAFGTAPDAQVLLTLASIIQLIKFDTTNYLGSPIDGNPNNSDVMPQDGEDWVIEANSDAATFNGEANFYTFQIENVNNYATANILVWDGTNSSNLSTIDWITSFVDFAQGGVYAAFQLGFANNFTGASRSVTLGIWAGSPASNTTAPEDTFTITQNFTESQY